MVDTDAHDRLRPDRRRVDGSRADAHASGCRRGAAIGDKIYVAGGAPPGWKRFEVYDISDDAWTPLPIYHRRERP
jgi:hypothetical protein